MRGLKKRTQNSFMSRKKGLGRRVIILFCLKTRMVFAWRLITYLAKAFCKKLGKKHDRKLDDDRWGFYLFRIRRPTPSHDRFRHEKPENICTGQTGLLEDLQNTRMAFRKDLKSFWTSYIGFHFSHSLGLIFYALVVVYCALARPDILADVYARIGIVMFGAFYVFLSRSFWFIIPFLGSLIGVTLIAVGMAMLY